MTLYNPFWPGTWEGSSLSFARKTSIFWQKSLNSLPQPSYFVVQWTLQGSRWGAVRARPKSANSILVMLRPTGSGCPLGADPYRTNQRGGTLAWSRVVDSLF